MSQAKVLHELLAIIVASVKDMGALGAPSGPLYASLMTVGMQLNQYQEIMGALVNAGNLKHSGHVYYWVKDIPAIKAA